MTAAQQRAELHKRIWDIANNVRGAIDGWDFKQYVLGALFYRFISENFASYIEADDDTVDMPLSPMTVLFLNKSKMMPLKPKVILSTQANYLKTWQPMPTTTTA